MKREYDFKKMKKRPGEVKVYPEAAKTAISLRLDSAVLVELKTEARRMGIPYQTFISSVLHRFVTGEIVDKKTIEMAKFIKVLK